MCKLMNPCIILIFQCAYMILMAINYFWNVKNVLTPLKIFQTLLSLGEVRNSTQVQVNTFIFVQYLGKDLH